MQTCRDFLDLILVLALVLGTAHPMASSTEMQRGAPASNLAMSVMGSDMSMSGLCDNCPKKGSATHDCFGACVGTLAIMPSVGFAPIGTNTTLAHFMEQLFNGSSSPPDLPPPKLTALS